MNGLPPIPLSLPSLGSSESSGSLESLSNSLTPLSPGLPLSTQPANTTNPLVGGFEAMLAETMQLERTAQQNVETALTGGDITQAEVLSAVKKADLSLRLLMQIRNKTLAAYNEVQQMRF